MRTAVLLGTKTLASAVATRLGPASIASHQVLTQVRVQRRRLCETFGQCAAGWCRTRAGRVVQQTLPGSCIYSAKHLRYE